MTASGNVAHVGFIAIVGGTHSRLPRLFLIALCLALNVVELIQQPFLSFSDEERVASDNYGADVIIHLQFEGPMP